jgi:hypothetical protein
MVEEYSVQLLAATYDIEPQAWRQACNGVVLSAFDRPLPLRFMAGVTFAVAETAKDRLTKWCSFVGDRCDCAVTA